VDFWWIVVDFWWTSGRLLVDFWWIWWISGGSDGSVVDSGGFLVDSTLW